MEGEAINNKSLGSLAAFMLAIGHSEALAIECFANCDIFDDYLAENVYAAAFTQVRYNIAYPPPVGFGDEQWVEDRSAPYRAAARAYVEGDDSLGYARAAMDMSSGTQRLQIEIRPEFGNSEEDFASANAWFEDVLQFHVPDADTGLARFQMNMTGAFYSFSVWPGAEGTATFSGGIWMNFEDTGYDGQDNDDWVDPSGLLALQDMQIREGGEPGEFIWQGELVLEFLVRDKQIVDLNSEAFTTCSVFFGVNCGMDSSGTTWLEFSSPDGVTFTSGSGLLLSNPYVPPQGVPEPGSLALLGLGLAALGVSRRRKA